MKNKIVTHASEELEKNGRSLFAREWLSVEAVTEEGAPYTFATIFHSKHGRTNMCGVGNSKFYAGGRSRTAIRKYAAKVDPNTEVKVFISAGKIIEI